MRARFSRILLVATLLTTVALAVSVGSAQTLPFRFELWSAGFDRPLYLVDPADGTGQLYVLEQGGTIRVVEADGAIRPEPLLDLSDQVSGGYEQGLLGMALDPDFAETGIAYVSYTDRDGTSQIVRYTRSTDEPVRLDPDSAEVILSVPQPAANHNGGMIDFGPDGYLYIGLGDGGGRGDPYDQGQDPSTLLGTILRIDPTQASDTAPYAIPDDNPFVGQDDARAEIWSYGLRNPWRFSFDRETGDLWIADVGQNAFEEVNLQPAGVGGMNFGWNLAEGFACYAVPDCEAYDIDWPVFSYGHDQGISITGGYVYRGTAIPELVGRYVVADFGSGNLWLLTPDGQDRVDASDPIPTEFTVSSFGEDADGELYIVDFAGAVYKIVPA